MKYSRFEELPVWQSAVELAVRVYEVTRRRAFRGPGDLVSQLRRAALSVSNNIAEGFERGTTAELLNFLYIARGSAGEVRSMLYFVGRLAGSGAARDGRLTMQVQGAASRSPEPLQDTGLARDARSTATTERNAGEEQQGVNERSEISDLRSERDSGEAGGGMRRSEISDLRSEIQKRTPGADSELSAEIDALLGLAESCSRQIRAWAERLQNSDIAGPKHLTEATRKAYENRKCADAFWRKVDAVMQERLGEMAQAPEGRDV